MNGSPSPAAARETGPSIVYRSEESNSPAPAVETCTVQSKPSPTLHCAQPQNHSRLQQDLDRCKGWFFTKSNILSSTLTHLQKGNSPSHKTEWLLKYVYMHGFEAKHPVRWSGVKELTHIHTAQFLLQFHICFSTPRLG